MSPARRSAKASGLAPPDLAAELEAGRVRPAYLLAGEEALLRDDARAAIQAAVLGDPPSDFDFERLEGESCGPGRLLDAVRSLPVLAPRRLVWLREVEGRRGGATALAEAVAEAVAELREREDCVLLVSAARADRRARWVKAFAEPAARVDCDPPRGERELVGWIRAEAERQGVALASGAAEALAERVGGHLLLLRQEIAKAALHAGDGATVTRDDVAATASDAAEEPVWDLTDAIGEGRVADALAVLGRLREAGVPPPMLLGSLASHFRKLARLRAGGSVAGHPFAVRKLESQARRYSAPRLLACLRAIQGTDTALKGEGVLTPALALERLVLGLAS